MKHLKINKRAVVASLLSPLLLQVTCEATPLIDGLNAGITNTVSRLFEAGILGLLF